MDLKKVNILIIEDNEDDQLFIEELMIILQNKKDIDIKINLLFADSVKNGKKILAKKPDISVILLDLNLPKTKGFATIEAIEELIPLYPVIILSSIDDRRIAEKAVQSGIQNYITKEDLNEEFLLRTIEFAQERYKIIKEKEELILNLENALQEVKHLSGLLPICACCKKIKNHEGGWQELEEYIESQSQAEVSHSICPECLNKFEED